MQRLKFRSSAKEPRDLRSRPAFPRDGIATALPHIFNIHMFHMSSGPLKFDSEEVRMWSKRELPIIWTEVQILGSTVGRNDQFRLFKCDIILVCPTLILGLQNYLIKSPATSVYAIWLKFRQNHPFQLTNSIEEVVSALPRRRIIHLKLSLGTFGSFNFLAISPCGLTSKEFFGWRAKSN